MIYNCTKDFLTAIKVEPTKRLDIYSPLFSWNVKLAKINRRNLVYMMNDASKLSVILYGLTSKEFKQFDQLAKEAIQEILRDCKIPDEYISQYVLDFTETIFTTTGTKKQLGVLNSAAQVIEFFFEERMENQMLQRQMSYQQNKGIMKNDIGDYITPTQFMRNRLWRTYSYSSINYDLEQIAFHMFDTERSDTLYSLNIKDGRILSTPRHAVKFDDTRLFDDFVVIPPGHTDFFGLFSGFAEHISHPRFRNDVARFGHGLGAVKRIKDLLNEYPEIEKQWVEYQHEVKLQKVREWLESIGL